MTLTQEDLKEWAELHVRNKDLIAQRIDRIDRDSEGWTFVVKRKDGTEQGILVQQELDSYALQGLLEEKGKACLVVPNTEENLQRLVDQWDSLIEYPSLCVIFANPESELETKWVVFPSTHHKITEPKHLKTGLRALFETVDVLEDGS